MKKLIFIFILFLSLVSFSQDYPKIELNNKGEKVVVFTLQQAQKIDNDLEVYALLKVARIKCDSLNLSYVKVIDEQNNQIVLLKNINKETEKQIVDKDKQFEILVEQNNNLQKNIDLCDKQKVNNQEQIDGLKSDVRKMKWKGLTGGFIGGVVATLVLILVTK
jgi:lipopolysaccharide export LptBFGC system permease protein LptF